MMISLQIKIERINCTHFDITKLCVFIFADFKNAKDCIIIEIPLKEISAQIAKMFGFIEFESSFAPRVTSTIPYKIPFIS